MPVSFLTATQRLNYGRYAGIPTAEDLAHYFHLDDADRALIATKRGEHNRLGFALQLTTVRFLGTLVDDLTTVPEVVIHTVAKQLDIGDVTVLTAYHTKEQRWVHTNEIRTRFGYREFVDPNVGFRLTRWLYALCWTGTERPSVIFDRATAWLLANKVLLPGASVLERFVARLRSRVEERLWRVLSRITPEQNARLNGLFRVPPGGRSSWLDRLRTGPVRVSAPALVAAIKRLQSVRDLGISLPSTANIPPSPIATLARFANTSKVTAVARLPRPRRIATLVAFVHTLEATAQDDSLEVLEILLHVISHLC
jgi:hypothetical protein